jgi:cytochrome b involved in lipid metabolism
MTTPERPRFYTPNEVSAHNTAKDVWVSFLGKVYDLTPFIEKNAGKIADLKTKIQGEFYSF